MLLITGICLAIGLIVSTLIGNLPQTINKIVGKQIEGEIERTMGKGMDTEKLKRKLEKYMKE